MKKIHQLKVFSPDELLLTEDEARLVLKFIFSQRDHALIDSLPMSNHLIGFAQALLVEAIDATYAVGFVHALFESTVNSTKGAMKIIKSFGKDAVKHWFKHASISDLKNVKVYDFVRNELAVRFRSSLYAFVSKSDESYKSLGFYAYRVPKTGFVRLWV